MRKREVRAANRTTKWCPKSPTARPWHPKWRPKVTTGASGARPGRSQDGSGDTFWPSFWIFSHFGTPWPRFWEPRGAPGALLAPQIGSSFDHSLLRSNIILLCTCGSIWRTIGSSLDHTFNNLFICKSVHLVGCPFHNALHQEDKQIYFPGNSCLQNREESCRLTAGYSSFKDTWFCLC